MLSADTSSIEAAVAALVVLITVGVDPSRRFWKEHQGLAGAIYIAGTIAVIYAVARR